MRRSRPERCVLHIHLHARCMHCAHIAPRAAGCTLRFLCKLKEPEILEPLIPTIKNNLEHRHSFVRRNAVLACFSIYKSFEELLPDGPALVEKVRRSPSPAPASK